MMIKAAGGPSQPLCVLRSGVRDVQLRQSQGFTLVELAVTLAVAAILATLAFPSMSQFIKNSRLKSETSGLVSALNLARTTAVANAATVTVCATATTSCSGTTDWSQGWGVWPTGTSSFVSRYDGAGGNAVITVTQNGAAVTTSKLRFYSDGTPDAVTTFKICDDRQGKFGRQIDVSVNGRATTYSDTVSCP